MVKEHRFSTSKHLFFLFICARKNIWFGYDKKKVENTSYLHGNVKKVLYGSYMMDWSICDEELEEDYTYIKHEKGLAL